MFVIHNKFMQRFKNLPDTDGLALNPSCEYTRRSIEIYCPITGSF